MPANFVQAAACPRDGYLDDWVVRSYLRTTLPAEVLSACEPLLVEMSALAAGPLWQAQLADRLNEPVLTRWDPWGNRIDAIEITRHWHTAQALAVRFGLTAIPYERKFGHWSRIVQFALAHLFHPVTDMYTCPLAMTDGAARTLLSSGNRVLIDRAVGHLTSRDPAQFWTSGQWMTESTGGSDVGLSRSVARRQEDGRWQLFGRKWFTSAATSQMALTLARPHGNGDGGRGLALFYLETRDAAGRYNGISIERLKDKLGTRKVPTAELTLDGTIAELVKGRDHGTHAIEPMLRITRAWNSVCAESFARHGVGLARDYAARRIAFGKPLADLPLHRETLDEMDAESAAAFVLTFFLIELLGADETLGLDDAQASLLRLLTPIVKGTTGRQAVAVVSEVIEAFGGAGYVEDTGLPVLLRDTHVLPIWEGTTNVLSLDLLLRANLDAGIGALRAAVAQACEKADRSGLDAAATVAGAALDHAERWQRDCQDPDQRQVGARRFALTLGRALALALLIRLAGRCTDPQDREAARGACLRFAQRDIDQIRDGL